jgi:hypothetical protein
MGVFTWSMAIVPPMTILVLALDMVMKGEKCISPS